MCAQGPRQRFIIIFGKDNVIPIPWLRKKQYWLRNQKWKVFIVMHSDVISNVIPIQYLIKLFKY